MFIQVPTLMCKSSVSFFFLLYCWSWYQIANSTTVYLYDTYLLIVTLLCCKVLFTTYFRGKCKVRTPLVKNFISQKRQKMRALYTAIFFVRVFWEDYSRFFLSSHKNGHIYGDILLFLPMPRWPDPTQRVGVQTESESSPVHIVPRNICK